MIVAFVVFLFIIIIDPIFLYLLISKNQQKREVK